MNKTILFSPVGGTDPMSQTNCHDGSMIHICRVYKPDKVYLYMSYEMLKYQEQDDRYRYCLEKLSEIQQREISYEIIEKPELTKVQEFDYFYEEFRQIIKEILETMDSTDKLLLNISSGTPAMKSGLLVLTTIGEFPCTSIQVSTPAKSINEHIHRDYDVETLWELNEDNQPEFENRCSEVHCPTLSLIKNEEIIKKHLAAFDYSAALEVARTLPKEKTKTYLELLEMGQARMLMDFKTSEAVARARQMDCFPIKSGNEKKYFEYALNLDLKLRRKEYADFIRGITPIIADLLELILKHSAGINVDQYCKEVHGIRKWDKNKLNGTNILQSLVKEYPQFEYKNVYSVHLLNLINSFANTVEIKLLAADLRKVEENIRNIAAHEIVSITEDTIRNKTGFTTKNIMEKIKKAFSYGGIKVKKEYWNSYMDMNEMIIAEMRK